MGKENPCPVCGETETKLVDGFYYCAECGTQDTNLQETVVEQVLRDGTFTFARRCRYKVKMKEGVEMSPEWYKWHKSNFLLAGLTEQLIELGAAPSLRMKVLWIWTRYIKRFQRKEEMGQSKVMTQLEESSSSDEEAPERKAPEREAPEQEAPEQEGPRDKLLKWMRIDRLRGHVLLAVLALALNQDRSHILLSHVTRLARYRLLPVLDEFRFVPPEILRHAGRRAGKPHTVYHLLPRTMGFMCPLLGLAPIAPDWERTLASQLRELRLPRGLRALVLALLAACGPPAPQDAQNKTFFPDFEAQVMAHVVVALKMCFGLDDHYERRLSDAVQRVNEDEDRPRAYSSEPSATNRLFSFREWSAYTRQRALVLCQQYAPLAWDRDTRCDETTALEHFREFTGERPQTGGHAGSRKGARAKVADQITMDMLNKIPGRFRPDVLPDARLRRAAAATEPHVELTRAVGDNLEPDQRRLLDEDFTEYSLEYAYRHLALPTTNRDRSLFRGVRRTDKTRCSRLRTGRGVFVAHADCDIVYVKDCANRAWARTRRPTAAHLVTDDKSDDGDDEPRASDDERKLDAFEEETEGRNIFDDDFFGVAIKEEKIDLKDEIRVDDTKDDANRGESFARFESEDEVDAAERGVFDSDDEEHGPRFDPATFDRREVIREIMIAAYARYRLRGHAIPLEFRVKDASKPPKVVKNKKRSELDKLEAAKRPTRSRRRDVDDILAAYGENLRRDALHHVQELVHAFTAARDLQPTPRLDADGSQPADENRSVDGSRREDGSQPADGSRREDGSQPANPMDVDESDVELMEKDKDADDAEDSCEERAYDPVSKSDARFDDGSHDPEQLFLKLKELPRRPEPEAERERDADVAAILDEKIYNIKEKAPKPRKRLSDRKERIDHLVEDPEGIGRYCYWFTKSDNKAAYRRVEREVQACFSRSFWFVLKECAAVLHLSPVALYEHVHVVEKKMLKLLENERKPPQEMRRRGRPRKDEGSRARERERSSDSADENLPLAILQSKRRKYDRNRSKRKSSPADRARLTNQKSPSDKADRKTKARVPRTRPYTTYADYKRLLEASAAAAVHHAFVPEHTRTPTTRVDESILTDTSVPLDLTEHASCSQNYTTEPQIWSETKLLNFDQF